MVDRGLRNMSGERAQEIGGGPRMCQRTAACMRCTLRAAARQIGWLISDPVKLSREKLNAMAGAWQAVWDRGNQPVRSIEGNHLGLILPRYRQRRNFLSAAT